MSKIEVYVAAADQGRAASDALPVWLNFSASVVTALAWPLTVIVLVLLLRKNIPQLLAVLKRLKGPGFEAEFERKVEKLEVDVIDQSSTLPTELPRSDVETAKDEQGAESSYAPEGSKAIPAAASVAKAYETASRRFKNDEVRRSATARMLGLEHASQLAVESPYAAVVMAWKEVSTAMRTVAHEHGITNAKTDRILLDRFIQKGILSSEMADTIKGLRDLRNRVSHEADFQPEQEAVKAYVEVAAKVIGYLYGSAFPD